MIKEFAIKKLRASWTDNFLIFKVILSLDTSPYFVREFGKILVNGFGISDSGKVKVL